MCAWKSKFTRPHNCHHVLTTSSIVPCRRPPVFRPTHVFRTSLLSTAALNSGPTRRCNCDLRYLRRRWQSMRNSLPCLGSSSQTTFPSGQHRIIRHDATTLVITVAGYGAHKTPAQALSRESNPPGMAEPWPEGVWVNPSLNHI
jgi:hypothetical protein